MHLRKLRLFFAFLFVFLALIAPNSNAASKNNLAHTAAPICGANAPSLAPMLKYAMPAIVNVATIRDVPNNMEDEFSFKSSPDTSHLPSGKYKLSSLASGVIIDAENG